MFCSSMDLRQSQMLVSSSPSFSLGFDLENLMEIVKTRGPWPSPAEEMEVEPKRVESPIIESLVHAPVQSAADVVMLAESEEEIQQSLKELDTVLVSEWEEPVWRGKKSALKSRSKEFLAPDAKFRATVAEGADNPSKNANRWALNRLKKFQQHIGQDSSLELVERPAADAVNLLYLFFEQATKKNGSLYPSGSLMNLLGGFNRTFRRKQEERIMNTGVDEAPFNMSASPLFRKVCVACVMAMRRSRAAGVGTVRKQVKVVTKKTEEEILADCSMAKTHSRGLFRRVGYYCMFRFSIRGGGELHRLAKADFEVGVDSEGRFVRYHERTSKNGKVTMKKFQPEHFRPAVKVYELDVVETFDMYYKHLPDGMSEFFLAVIDNPRTTSWYSRSAMGERTLSLLVKQIFEENGLDADEFSNKSGRTTLVTQMGEAGVPSNVGMLVTGHASEKAYSRYDKSKEAKVKAAQRCATEESLTYVQALEEETAKLKCTMIDGANDESPAKLIKSNETADVSSARESIALKLTELKIDAGSSSLQSGDVGLTAKNAKGSQLRRLEDVQDPFEWEWMEHFDWEDDLRVWEQGKSININPISGLIGKLVNCTGLTINFHGNVNFKN